MVWIILGVIGLASLFVGWSCCRIAGLADEADEKLYRELAVGSHPNGCDPYDDDGDASSKAGKLSMLNGSEG